MAEHFDPHKFEELIIFIARRCESDATFGTTKLSKLLFFVDFTAYRKFGHSLTGADYQKLEHGPAPKQLLSTRTTLMERGDLFTVTREYFGKEQKRLIAGREPDVSGFRGDEIALVDEMIEQLRDLNATSASSLSHEFIGWRAVDYGGLIPYETARIQPESLSEAGVVAAIEFKVADWNDSAGWPRIPIKAPLH